VKRLAEVFIVWGILAAGGCSDSVTPDPGVPFSMQVIPEQISKAILDQKFVFLVTVRYKKSWFPPKENYNGGTPVKISASAANAAVIVYPQSIVPGEVSEITVTPFEVNPEGALTVFFKGERDGLEVTDSISFELTYFEDQLAPYAIWMRDNTFIPWLEQNYTKLGITSETAWTGTIVLPGTYEVSSYLFFSEQWEMGIEWHATTAPDDWARIYLRHRFIQTTPSFAFEIPSYSERDPVPFAITPPDSIYR